MNKTDLISEVAESMGESKTKAAAAVDAVFEAMTKALKGGDEVRVPDFGIFKVVETKERTARNPKSGEAVKVPAGKKARFQPAKALKEAVESAKGKKGAKK